MIAGASNPPGQVAGCGKTTLLRLVAGFERPDEGEIHIGDRLVASAPTRAFVPAERRRIGFVLQDYAVWPHKTVYENVVHPLGVQRVARGEARERARRTIGLSGLEDRLPFQLSGGQQQRVALALVSAPDVMLLDERGAIRQIGTPDDVYERPSNSFVFRFLGVCNLVPVEERAGRTFLAGTGCPFDAPDRPGAPGGPRPRSGPLVAGFRPSDVRLAKAAAGAEAVLRRAVYLGTTMDYRVTVGAHEIRVQAPSCCRASC